MQWSAAVAEPEARATRTSLRLVQAAVAVNTIIRIATPTVSSMMSRY